MVEGWAHVDRAESLARTAREDGLWPAIANGRAAGLGQSGRRLAVNKPPAPT